MKGRAPDPDAAWESFVAMHNKRVVSDDPPQPPTGRGARRSARKRTACALCGTPLLGTGRPMSRGRWRCDVQAGCDDRRAVADQLEASGL